MSAGNHAIAVGYAARALGTSAKVVMLSAANPARVAACRAYGAEIVPVDDVHTAFDVAQADRTRRRPHPDPSFRGPAARCSAPPASASSSTDQVPALDAVIVPIGGGGLVRRRRHRGQARPTGAARSSASSPRVPTRMHRSFAAGEPQAIDRVRTIADSLGAPHAAPYTFGLCHRFIDQFVMVDDDQIRDGMACSSSP